MNQVLGLFLAIALTATTAAQQSAVQPQQKTIKNPAEYNAYMSAISQQDPNAKAQALEAFLQQYPDSVVKEETLEHLMIAYQQAAAQASMEPRPRVGVLAGGIDSPGNLPRRVADTAESLFYVNPDNLRALAVLVNQKLVWAKATQALDSQGAARLRRDAAELAKRGLKVVANTPQPASMSNDAFAKYISGLTAIFSNALPGPSRGGQ